MREDQSSRVEAKTRGVDGLCEVNGKTDSLNTTCQEIKNLGRKIKAFVGTLGKGIAKKKTWARTQNKFMRVIGT